MKTIIVYYSKYGSAKKVATKVADALSCECIDVTKQHEVSAPQILCVSATYIGRIHKTMKEIILAQPEATRIGFLKVGMGKDDIPTVLEENLHEAKHKIRFYGNAGGMIKESSLTFFEKMIFRMVNRKVKLVDRTQQDDLHDFLNEQEIEAFIDAAR